MNWKYPLRRLLLPRRFHAFGVGCPRSGTRSVASICRPVFRSRHEASCGELQTLYVKSRQGQLDGAALANALKARDRRLWLEMDSNSFYGLFVSDLVTVFPKALFILTLRDCYSWLDSILDHVIAGGGFRDSETWSIRRDWLNATGPLQFSKYESELERLGLVPVKELLQYWSDNHYRILNAVPQRNLLLIRTDRLSDKLSNIARFLGQRVTALNTASCHTNKTAAPTGVLGRLDAGFVNSQVETYCGDLMEEYFPEINSVHDGLSLRH